MGDFIIFLNWLFGTPSGSLSLFVFLFSMFMLIGQVFKR